MPASSYANTREGCQRRAAQLLDEVGAASADLDPALKSELTRLYLAENRLKQWEAVMDHLFKTDRDLCTKLSQLRIRLVKEKSNAN